MVPPKFSVHQRLTHFGFNFTLSTSLHTHIEGKLAMP